MTDLRTAAQQALEALEAIDEDPHGTHSFPALSNDAITALRAALAQDKQEWTGIPGTNVRVKVQPPLMWGGRLIPQTDTPTVPRGVFYTPPECKQKEQEPVAWIQPDHLQKARQAPFLCRVEPTQRCADFVPFYTHPPRRETEQEPVAWMVTDKDGRHFIFRINKPVISEGETLTPLYTHPPRREWQSLTEEEIAALYVKWDDTPGVSMADFSRAIEQALKERNNG